VISPPPTAAPRTPTRSIVLLAVAGFASQAQVRVTGWLEADPRWKLPDAERTWVRSRPVTRPFAAVLPSEILVPEQQAADFLAKVTADPRSAEAPYPRPPALTRETARAVVDKFWPGTATSLVFQTYVAGCCAIMSSGSNNSCPSIRVTALVRSPPLYPPQLCLP